MEYNQHKYSEELDALGFSPIHEAPLEGRQSLEEVPINKLSHNNTFQTYQSASSATHPSQWQHTCKRLLRGRGLAAGSSAAGSISEATEGGRLPLAVTCSWEAGSMDLAENRSPVVPRLTGRGEVGEEGSPENVREREAALECPPRHCKKPEPEVWISISRFSSILLQI